MRAGRAVADRLVAQFDFLSLLTAPSPPPPPVAVPPPADPDAPGGDFVLADTRDLAASWADRARANLAAIRLADDLIRAGRPATVAEQTVLARFTGYGASDLANGCFRRPGEGAFRAGWETIGQELEAAVSPEEYAALARGTQYAHFTPEGIVRAIWAGLTRLGFAGGRVLEPGIGTGLFAALAPAALRPAVRFTGVEADPVTARIAGLLYPGHEIRTEDFGTSRLAAHYALALGNPPFSTRIVRTDPAYRTMGLRLHDFFIVKATDHLLPGGLAAFVTSRGTMDKADDRVRAYLAGRCDLIGAIRLPDGTFAATAGTDVGVDILFLRRRRPGEAGNGVTWNAVIPARITGSPGIAINAYFLDNPAMVLGTHAAARGPYGPDPVYACPPVPGRDLDAALAAAVARLPAGIADCPTDCGSDPVAAPTPAVASGDNARLREGSYLVADDVLMQVVDGAPAPVPIKAGRGTDGIFPKHARLIRALIPIRDSVRAILADQERCADTAGEQARLGTLYAAFVAAYGPINATTVQVREAAEGEARTETHRQPNLAPFRDDPDCWLVASIEGYDLESNTATRGPIFTDRVIARPVEPEIRTAADALARCLHDHGAVDLDVIARHIGTTEADAVEALGSAIYRDPETGSWETADAYLSGTVRTKLAAATAAAAADPAYARNVPALEAVQPTDLPPSDITARLGAPWIPTENVAAFIREIMEVRTIVRHTPEVAAWSVEEWRFNYAHAADRQFGTHRYPAVKVLLDALNARIPAIYDEDFDGRRELNVEETEAAKEKLSALKVAFEAWVWRDPDRADRLARIYNDAFNNLVARRFDGSHLTLPGAAAAFRFYPHQKDVIWRMVAAGGTYIAHAVGAGKSASMAAAVMEQRRLGLITKAIIAVPGHCLAQFAREFLALYPLARILVADETNFARDKRRRFLARAATGDWDAIIITHAAFKLIPLPVAFERRMTGEMVDAYESLLANVDSDDRLTRKKLERQKETYRAKLEGLASRKDDFLTLGEIGVDQIIVDEAQEFRKLAFTSSTHMKGIDTDGSQMAWDLYAKARFVRAIRAERAGPGGEGVDRALNLASGTPITNTLGEMFTAQRFMAPDALEARNLHEFDAWAAAFGETRTELELQPSGRYKPVTRFAEFVNVPELIAMFRAFADVVSAEDLKRLVKRPRIAGGKRQLITAPASGAFRAYQKVLDARIKAIEARSGQPKPGDDIILAVIGDGRHAAIDLRFVIPGLPAEPDNKLARLIDKAHAVYVETAARTYLQPDGTPFERPGATQMIFSDLGTLNAERTRGFSAYRWIKDCLVARGVPADEIAYVQDYKGSQAKNRLFADMRAGKVRITIGSTRKMGTGVNAQNRLVALHHLDVPWIPSDIEQREGRIDRQGNQNPEIGLYAYATEGSMDATLWQANERKARFIAAALSGDRSVRRLEDVGEGAVNQFAMAKAIASGDPRLLQKAGLEAEIARLERLRRAHLDEQHTYRARVRSAEREIEDGDAYAARVRGAIAAREPAADPPRLVVGRASYADRTEGGRALIKAMRRIEHGLMSGERTAETLGTCRGFEIGYAAGSFAETMTGDLEVSAAGLRLSLRAGSNTAGALIVDQVNEAIDSLDGRLELTERRVARATDERDATLPLIGRPFELEGELAFKREALDAITADLARSEDPATEAEALAKAA